MNRIRRWIIKSLGGYTHEDLVFKVDLQYAYRDDLIDELRMKHGAQTVYIPEGNRFEVLAYSKNKTVPALLNGGPAHVIIVSAGKDIEQNIT